LKILALETSTITGGVAIVEDKRLIAEARLSIKAIYSERLMALIDFLLKSVRLTIFDMDCFALAIGPGSFTGLRVGLSTVKGLAYGTDKLIAPVSTLKALAMNIALVKEPICPILDAHKGEVYWALYRNSSVGLETLIPEHVGKVYDIFPYINERTIFIGEGALLYRKEIDKALNEMAILGDGIYPSPYNVALLGYQEAIMGNLKTAVEIKPKYYRKAEAEIKLQR